MLAEPSCTWTPKVCNHNLIHDLAVALRNAGALCQGVFKVASHQKSGPNTPVAEKWCCAGNDAADHVAGKAFGSSPTLMQSWRCLCKQLDSLRELRNQLHTMFLNIGVECVLKSLLCM